MLVEGRGDVGGPDLLVRFVVELAAGSCRLAQPEDLYESHVEKGRRICAAQVKARDLTVDSTLFHTP